MEARRLSPNNATTKTKYFSDLHSTGDRKSSESNSTDDGRDLHFLWSVSGIQTTGHRRHLRGGILKEGGSTRGKRGDPRERGSWSRNPADDEALQSRKHGRRQGIETLSRHSPAISSCNHQGRETAGDHCKALAQMQKVPP